VVLGNANQTSSPQLASQPPNMADLGIDCSSSAATTLKLKSWCKSVHFMIVRRVTKELMEFLLAMMLG